MRFIGRNIFTTTIDVGVQAGNFGRIPLEQLLMKRDTLRAPRAGYARQDWTFTNDSWATEENRAEEPIDDREEAMYQNYFSQELIATKRAFHSVMVNQEMRAREHFSWLRRLNRRIDTMSFRYSMLFR
jgi:hypothetical protein